MVWLQGTAVSLGIILLFTYGMYKSGIYDKNIYRGRK